MNQNLGEEQEQEFLTKDEAAALLGVSESGVTQMVLAGKFTNYRAGRKTVLLKSEVEQSLGLKEAHGKFWYKYAPWYQEPETSEGEATETEEAEETETPKASLAQKMIELANEFKADGDYVTACKIQDAVLSHYDFSE